MISGTVTDLLEATLALTVRGPDGQSESVEAIIDTGFTGFLTLPYSAIELLNLTWLCRQQGMLADGNTHTFDVYVGTVVWDDAEREIEVEAADIDPLVGMAMLNGHQLTVHVQPGGEVKIDRL